MPCSFTATQSTRPGYGPFAARPSARLPFQRPKRPRLACRELILPEPEEEMVTVTPVAMVVHNKVFYARDWYLDDFMQSYPERLTC